MLYCNFVLLCLIEYVIFNLQQLYCILQISSKINYLIQPGKQDITKHNIERDTIDYNCSMGNTKTVNIKYLRVYLDKYLNSVG